MIAFMSAVDEKEIVNALQEGLIQFFVIDPQME
jgi:hypothetical protein